MQMNTLVSFQQNVGENEFLENLASSQSLLSSGLLGEHYGSSRGGNSRSYQDARRPSPAAGLLRYDINSPQDTIGPNPGQSAQAPGCLRPRLVLCLCLPHQ